MSVMSATVNRHYALLAMAFWTRHNTFNHEKSRHTAVQATPTFGRASASGTAQEPTETCVPALRRQTGACAEASAASCGHATYVPKGLKEILFAASHGSHPISQSHITCPVLEMSPSEFSYQQKSQ